jgi:anti-sigma factor RsiW
MADRAFELLDGALDAADEHAMREHLHRCQRCRTALAHTRRLLAALARQSTEAPPSLRARVAAQLVATRPVMAGPGSRAGA